jgi:hypothetical protein
MLPPLGSFLLRYLSTSEACRLGLFSRRSKPTCLLGPVRGLTRIHRPCLPRLRLSQLHLPQPQRSK